MRFLAAMLVLAAAGLTSCATSSVRTAATNIVVATDVNFVLPPAAGLRESFDATQLIVAEYQDRSDSFQAQLEARPGRITIVGVTVLGGPLFSIRYDGEQVIATGASDALALDPGYVLADVLLTHWDIGQLNNCLQGAVVVASADGAQRSVRRGGVPVIDIRYPSTGPWTGTTVLHHIERQYVLRITTVEFSRP